MLKNNHSEARGFIRLPEVLTLIPISKSRWYEGIKLGQFPAPIKLTERTSAWRVEDINLLVQQLSNQGRV